MKISENVRKAIVSLQNKYPEKRSALIPALHLAQAEIGYLPADVQNEVAELFDLDHNEVNAVVTFYDMFFEEPTGKHLIHVCKNVSCMLRGSDELLVKLCEKLEIAPGCTTADGEFTVMTSECLAACDRAPMMLVDEKVVGPVKIEELDTIIANAKKGHGHSCPVKQEMSHA